jgi:murein DD-endopeptidase MepM/ murein hydrolase activator NlpD
MSAGFRNYRSAVNIALAGAAVALLGGCASDATRLSDPFSNPFQTAARNVDPAATGAIPEDMPARSGGFGNAPIQSSALPPPGAAASAEPFRGPTASQHTYTPPQQAAQPPRGAGVAGNWSAQGGTPITVKYGETPSMLANRYGVPAEALLRVNGFASASQVQPGAKLIIPVYSANAAAPTRTAQVTPVRGKPEGPAKMAAPQPKFVLVKGKDGKAVKTQLAAPPKEQPAKGKSVDAKAAKPAKTAEAHTPAAAKPTQPVQPAPSKIARIEAAPVAKVQTVPAKPAVDPQPTASLPAKAEAAPAPAADANPEFRWPARGRIIQGFKSGGNDGINISVPEGTAVKAAENGVVAYAGSELKGYGNLVLIRHPNGFVSAYANNGELNVKRGETVKRGQTIAKSGQSGNVATPQLHFELRKGSTPVDPTNYLAGL